MQIPGELGPNILAPPQLDVAPSLDLPEVDRQRMLTGDVRPDEYGDIVVGSKTVVEFVERLERDVANLVDEEGTIPVAAELDNGYVLSQTASEVGFLSVSRDPRTSATVFTLQMALRGGHTTIETRGNGYHVSTKPSGLAVATTIESTTWVNPSIAHRSPRPGRNASPERYRSSRVRAIALGDGAVSALLQDSPVARDVYHDRRNRSAT